MDGQEGTELLVSIGFPIELTDNLPDITRVPDYSIENLATWENLGITTIKEFHLGQLFKVVVGTLVPEGGDRKDRYKVRKNLIPILGRYLQKSTIKDFLDYTKTKVDKSTLILMIFGQFYSDIIITAQLLKEIPDQMPEELDDRHYQ